MIIISPHLDDAVLSCGQLLAAYPHSTVITVFAGIPGPELRWHTEATSFDRNCGFNSGVEAMSARREEDMRAAAVLDFTPIHMDYLDGQYTDEPVPIDELAHALKGVLNTTPGEMVIAPFGIEHPDHMAAAAATGLLIADFVYEELPGRVLWPPRTDLDSCPWLLDLDDDLVHGPLELKQAAIGCYRSQLWALDLHACLVPERYWRLR